MSRLATQVYDFRKTVEQAQMMSRATMGMNRLEKQMDLAKVGESNDKRLPYTNSLHLAHLNHGRIQRKDWERGSGHWHLQ